MSARQREAAEPIPLHPEQERQAPEREPRPAHGRPELRRSDVYQAPLIDGRELRESAFSRLAERIRTLLTTPLEREEARLEAELRSERSLERTNTIAVISPKGGVGKTTSTVLLGNLLATHLRLRVLAIDANSDFGTLAALVSEELRSSRSLADLLADMDEIEQAAELRPYVSRLPSGLHVLGAPAEAEAMAAITPSDYGKLLDFAGRWYEAVLLDLGTGIAGEFAQFALGRADQAVIVTTPEWITATNVSGALRHIRPERATLLMNQARARDSDGHRAISAHFRTQDLAKRVSIPYDERLRTMLDSATYSLGALDRATRVPVKRLGLAVARQLL